MITREFRPWMKPLPDGEGFGWRCAICQILLHRGEIHQDWQDKDKPGVILCPGCYLGRRMPNALIDSQKRIQVLRDALVDCLKTFDYVRFHRAAGMDSLIYETHNKVSPERTIEATQKRTHKVLAEA